MNKRGLIEYLLHFFTFLYTVHHHYTTYTKQAAGRVVIFVIFIHFLRVVAVLFSGIYLPYLERIFVANVTHTHRDGNFLYTM